MCYSVTHFMGLLEVLPPLITSIELKSNTVALRHQAESKTYICLCVWIRSLQLYLPSLV